MEMHLVFQDANSHLLVVGRWVEEGAKNVALDPIFSHIPQNTTTTLAVDHFNLNSLIPANLESFRYDGSLTTPPFSEGVKWVDLATPLDMSSDQIKAFSSLFPPTAENPMGGTHVRFRRSMGGSYSPMYRDLHPRFPNRKPMPCCWQVLG